MIAHSAGAFVSLLFANRHPGTVIGMVLIDPSIPDEDAVRQRVAPRFAALGERSANGYDGSIPRMRCQTQEWSAAPGNVRIQRVYYSATSRLVFRFIKEPCSTKCESCEVTDPGLCNRKSFAQQPSGNRPATQLPEDAFNRVIFGQTSIATRLAC